MNSLKDILRYILGRKKYWFIPVLTILILLGLLLTLGGTALAPFIYSLF